MKLKTFSQSALENMQDNDLRKHLNKRYTKLMSCDTCIKEDKCDKDKSIKCLGNDFKYYQKG